MDIRPAWVFFAIAAWLPLQTLHADQVDEILNYREYSATLASAGQPNEAQLGDAAGAGFERVVFLAFSDHERALAHEDRIVRDLGMEYVHIPVIWGAPHSNDFYAFAGAMQREKDRKTLVHCELNFRASSFTLLYRVLYLDVPLADAIDDLTAVWIPSDTWRQFIFSTLEENGVSPHCDECLW